MIANTGDIAVSQPFWVDLAIDPDMAPAAPNDTWQVVGPRGLAWGVTRALAPGERLTLRVGDDYYRADVSFPDGPIFNGTVLYAHVDSADTTTNYGRVQESHERQNQPYNNILMARAERSIVLPFLIWTPPTEGLLRR